MAMERRRTEILSPFHAVYIRILSNTRASCHRLKQHSRATVAGCFTLLLSRCVVQVIKMN